MSGSLPNASPIRFHGPAGALEGLYRPGLVPGRAALLCHPHPLFGGTMHNRVIFQFERALARTGRATMRFNFRGAGASEGLHDGGRGETGDVLAAADELVARSPGAAIDVVGYSFGCWVGWRALATDPRARSFTGIGLALDLGDLSFIGGIDRPIVIVHGEEDELASAERIRAFVSTLPRPPRLFLIEGADHLFTRGYDRLLATIPDVVEALD